MGMRTVAISEVRAHLSRWFETVAHGEQVAITRRGQLVAMLVPPPGLRDPDHEAAKAAIEAWEKYRKEHNITTGGMSIREMIEEGRRY